MSNQCLVLNGVFHAGSKDNAIAAAFETRSREALASMPAGLAKLPRQNVRLSPRALLGVEALRHMFDDDARAEARAPATNGRKLPPSLKQLVDELSVRARA